MEKRKVSVYSAVHIKKYDKVFLSYQSIKKYSFCVKLCNLYFSLQLYKKTSTILFFMRTITYSDKSTPLLSEGREEIDIILITVPVL